MTFILFELCKCGAIFLCDSFQINLNGPHVTLDFLKIFMTYFAISYHDLHGRPARRSPVHGHSLIDHMRHCSHYLCKRETRTNESTVINWTVGGAKLQLERTEKIEVLQLNLHNS